MKRTSTPARALLLSAILAALASFPSGGSARVRLSAAVPAGTASAAPRHYFSALAPAATAGTRRTVCAASLKVRGAAPPGYYIGELDRGETFLLVREGDVWAYGFAYGRVNKWGYVMKKYLC